MTPYKPAFFVTVGAFAIAVIVPWCRGRPTSQAEAPVAEPPARSDFGGAAPAESAYAQAERRIADLQRRLETCEQRSWNVVLESMHKDAKARGVASAQASASDSGYERQQLALCEITRAAMRDRLKQDQETIAKAFEAVGSEQWTADWIEQKLAAETELFGLDPAARERLAHDYERLWAERGPEMARLVSDPNPDYAALMGSVRAFWQQEDALMERQLGAEARNRYRVSELLSRTAIIATLAAFANQPWDQSIAW